MVEALLTLSLCFRAEGNRAYPLKMKNVILPVYCHLTDDLGACGGGGWTLVMKIDGKEVFKRSTLGRNNSSKIGQRIRELISLRGVVTMFISLKIFFILLHNIWASEIPEESGIGEIQEDIHSIQEILVSEIQEGSKNKKSWIANFT